MVDLARLAYSAAWVWGWVVIADDDDWSMLKGQYRPVYRLILAFQIWTTLFGCFYVAKKKKSEADDPEAGEEGAAVESVV